MKFFISICFVFLIGHSFGQRSSYNHCSGAVFAPVSGSFTLPYLGEKNKNQIWVVFIAPKSGEIHLTITTIGSSLALSKGVIKRSDSEICDLSERQNQTVDSISFEIRSNESINFHVEKNQFASLCLTTSSGITDAVVFNCEFLAENTQEEEHVMDLVYDKTLPTYTLLIRDEQTLIPVAGRIFLQGSPEVSGSYYASKLHLNLKQPIKKGTLKIDAPGYFPVEFKEKNIPLNGQKTDTIRLHKFEAGELTKLEQVYFSAGLPEIMEESFAQLNRLRDLLLLNPSMSIEIHGHVNLDENSAKKAQKLSKQRALMVKKYLVQNGVSPERLFPIGFGSSKPIYERPQSEEQKEANRRVEILIRKY